MPCGDSTCVDSVTNTGDDSAKDELFNLERGGHEESASHHDAAASHDGLATTKGVADENTDNRAEETSQIVRCDRNTLVGRTLRLSGLGEALLQRIDGWEVSIKRGKIQQATSDTLIITKEPVLMSQSPCQLSIAPFVYHLEMGGGSQWQPTGNQDCPKS